MDRTTPRLSRRFGELGIETLDRVEPRCGRWREMECPAWMPHQPGPPPGMLVRRIVVGDGVDPFARRDTGLDGVEEADELLMPVALHAAPDHAAVQHTGLWCRGACSHA